jgi:hypothetical protein
MQDWKTYGWLTFLALCASMVRWPDIVKDKEGHARWGLLFIQFPTAIATGAMAHAAAPAVQHFLPYAGDFVAEGLASAFAFAGPLAAPKLIDALIDIVRNRLGGTR